MEILVGRQKKAEALKKMTDVAVRMSEEQLVELRADIKVSSPLRFCLIQPGPNLIPPKSGAAGVTQSSSPWQELHGFHLRGARPSVPARSRGVARPLSK